MAAALPFSPAFSNKIIPAFFPHRVNAASLYLPVDQRPGVIRLKYAGKAASDAHCLKVRQWLHGIAYSRCQPPPVFLPQSATRLVNSTLHHGNRRVVWVSITQCITFNQPPDAVNIYDIGICGYRHTHAPVWLVTQQPFLGKQTKTSRNVLREISNWLVNSLSERRAPGSNSPAIIF